MIANHEARLQVNEANITKLDQPIVLDLFNEGGKRYDGFPKEIRPGDTLSLDIFATPTKEP